MKVVIGLGNPGVTYKETRHNAGWYVLDTLATNYGAGKPQPKYRSQVQTITVNNQGVMLLKPSTFMNLSGEVISAIKQAGPLDLSDVLIICDDVHVKLGRIRIRPGGSAGGHNGLKSVEQHLGTNQYSRLRIGVSQPDANITQIDWVLGLFSGSELPILMASVNTAVDAVVSWIEYGTLATMPKFNGISNVQASE